MTTTIDRPMSMQKATGRTEEDESDSPRLALLVTRSLGAAVLESVANIEEKPKLLVINEVADRKVIKWCEDRQQRRVVYMKEHASYVTHCVRQFGADAVLAAHWNQYVPQPLREATKWGVLAYHPSVLPKYRGNDSVRDQAKVEEPYPGGTVYQMDEGLDTGPIVMQRSAPRRAPYDAGVVWKEWLFPLGVSLLTEVARRVCRGDELTFASQGA